MKRFAFGVLVIAAIFLGLTSCRGRSVLQQASPAASTVPFEANFTSASDFYDRFDYGYSGENPLSYGDGITHFHGDHDKSCGGPTTNRDVAFGGDATKLDFSQLFWFCAPGGDPTKGHMMTGVDTHGYNVAWFSPKPTFSNISKVCWDINATDVGARKWTGVLFVGRADATRDPTGSATFGGGVTSVARGTGGFDLGYTDPDFREKNPNDGIFPQGGTLAGFRDLDGSASWFQNQDTWMTLFAEPKATLAGTDKATRFTHCLENMPGNVVRNTEDTPAGTVVRDMVGQIPQDSRRVVFTDDNYNPEKDSRLNPSSQTWHWDNIQVFAGTAT